MQGKSFCAEGWTGDRESDVICPSGRVAANYFEESLSVFALLNRLF
jgi:hypothetical protein